MFVQRFLPGRIEGFIVMRERERETEHLIAVSLQSRYMPGDLESAAAQLQRS